MIGRSLVALTVLWTVLPLLADAPILDDALTYPGRSPEPTTGRSAWLTVKECCPGSLVDRAGGQESKPSRARLVLAWALQGWRVVSPPAAAVRPVSFRAADGLGRPKGRR